MPELFLDLHQHIMDPDRIPYAIMAILIAAIMGIITGPLFGNAYPMTWIIFDKIFGNLGDKMDKPGRAKGDLIFRGFMVSAIALVFALMIGQSFELIALKWPHSNMMEGIVLSCTLTVGAVWFSMLRLHFALSKTEKLVEGAYLAIARTHRANLNASDDFGITRLAMGLSVRAFDKGLVSPVFWYLVAGLPAAVIYSCLAALSWRFGRDGAGNGFGHAPIALERLMGFVPSLFSAAIVTLASMFAPTAKVGKGLASWMGMKDRASYEQGGFPLSALAWSLNVSLGGAYQDIAGNPIKGGWVGPEGATAKNDYQHLRRAMIISLICHSLFIVSLASAYMWGTSFEMPDLNT